MQFPHELLITFATNARYINNSLTHASFENFIAIGNVHVAVAMQVALDKSLWWHNNRNTNIHHKTFETPNWNISFISKNAFRHVEQQTARTLIQTRDGSTVR